MPVVEILLGRERLKIYFRTVTGKLLAGQEIAEDKDGIKSWARQGIQQSGNNQYKVARIRRS